MSLERGVSEIRVTRERDVSYAYSIVKQAENCYEIFLAMSVTLVNLAFITLKRPSLSRGVSTPLLNRPWNQRLLH